MTMDYTPTPQPGGGDDILTSPGGGTSGPTIRQGNDGQYYQLIDGAWVVIPGMPGENLTTDLRALGLVPLSSMGGVQSDPQAQSPEGWAGGSDIGGTRDRATSKGNIDQSALWVDPNTGLLYLPNGSIAPEWVHENVYGEGGPGGTSDPYAGNRDARDQQRLNEQIRSARLGEAQNAIDNQRQRMMMRLEGSQWALPPGNNGYFPAVGPGDPLVKSGLASPQMAQPIAFNADAGSDPAQIEKDLAMIRQAAGVGG